MMRPDAPDPVAPGSTPDPATDPPAPPPSPAARRPAPAASRRAVVLSIAIAIVAVLAGSRAVPVRLHARAGRRRPSRARRSPKPTRSSRSGTRTTRSPTRYAGGEVDRDDPHPGRDQGDDRRARRPVLRVPDVATSTSTSLQGISGQFEGIGAEIGTQAQRRDPGLHAARAGLPPRGRQRRSTGSPAEKAGLSRPATSSLAIDGTTLDGLTVDARPRPGSAGRRARS